MSDQDRWEENAGASPFTLTVTICALVAAAPLFAAEERAYLLSLADCWNERIERWTYSTAGGLCATHGVDGYYVRLAPRNTAGGLRGNVDVRNVANGTIAASELVGMEFLYLVRSGLRAFDDPRIVNTLKVVDSVLRRDTPSGPSYYRYNGDGYGEHVDGSPFDGSGIGRLWPLLTGERGHYAVASGEDAGLYLEAMSRMTGPGGLIPEQIWDETPIPDLGLAPGKPSGSAMPLVWAHAEFLKLLAARANGRAAELLDAVTQRYGSKVPDATTWHWRNNSPFSTVPFAKAILVERPEPFTLKVGLDGAPTAPRQSVPTAFGLHGVTIHADELTRCKVLRLDFPTADDNESGEGVEIAILPGN